MRCAVTLSGMGLSSERLPREAKPLADAEGAPMVMHQSRSTGASLLETAMVNGAEALGLLSEIGSIEVGKRADPVLHRMGRSEAHPLFVDPVDNPVFYTR